MKFGRRSKGPARDAVAFDDFRNLIGELSVNAAIGFVFQLGLRDRSGVLKCGAVSDRETTGLVSYFVKKFTVSVSCVECLDETQAWSSRGRFIYSIGFQTSAVGDDKSEVGARSIPNDVCA
jgi:hypothetical protein